MRHHPTVSPWHTALPGRSIGRTRLTRAAAVRLTASKFKRCCLIVQTIVELPDALGPKLAELARRGGVSEADVVTAAVQKYLEQSSSEETDPAFGLWLERAVDGVAYQERMRSEWQTE